MKNKLFSLTLLLLLILGIGILIKPQHELSDMEKRGLMKVNDIKLDGNIDDLENTLKDQFYFRNIISKNYYRIKVTLTKLFKTKLSDNEYGIDSYVVLNDKVSEINEDYLIYNILTYDENYNNTVSSRGYNITELVNKFPLINTYVYFPTRIEEIMDIPAGYNYGRKYREAFIKQLNPIIKYDELKIKDFNDHKNWFYKSDNHWNVFGAYEGYKDIINMIKKDFDIVEPRKYDDSITYDYEFIGNLSTQIGGIGSKDKITDLIFNDINNFDYYINGEKTDFNKEKKYYQEHGNNTEYYDYGVYFGNNDYFKEFDFHQEDKPNLLIFGDSFLNTNNSWIASHFNKTIIIDLRDKPDDFNLENYINEYKIDAILITMAYWDIYENGYMYIPVN